MKCPLSAAITLLAAPLLAEEKAPIDFSGEYVNKGYDIAAKSHYSGIATIEKQESGVYEVRWAQGAKKFFATGLPAGPHAFSLISIGPSPVEKGQMQVNITVLNIKNPDTLQGRWVVLGQHAIGGTEEFLKK